MKFAKGVIGIMIK